MGYKISAEPPTKRPGSGVPVSRMIVTLGVLGLLGLVVLGARQLMGTVNIVSVPLVGEWQARHKPWRLDFRPDKTIVSSAIPSASPVESGGVEAKGTYSVDYSATLWVKLSNGKIYTAALSEAAPNRFDLIESGTDGVTAFERVLPSK